jgi:ribosome-associated translation inhibitor RaiA
MKVQFNTDKTISGNERNEAFFTTHISEQLDRFQSEITRIEVHLSDENGDKKGTDDKHCLLEARLQGRQPIAVSNNAPTIEKAVSGALDKLKKSLDSILKQSHRQ